MEFGKIDNFATVDFSFPAEPESNLNNWGSTEFKVYVGAPVFTNQALLRKILPVGSISDNLSVYSKFFSCIELNSSFYSIPSKDQILSWSLKVGADFKFAPKFIKTISQHGTGFSTLNSIISEYLSSIVHFKEKLGLSFIQFPETFTLDYLHELESFLSRMPKGLKLATELRSKDFMGTPFAFPKVILDVAGRRDLFDLTLARDWTMVRFVGNSLHNSDFKRLDDWCDLLLEWKDRGMREVYFILHQPDESNCYELGLYLKEKLGDLVIGCNKLEKDQLDFGIK